jgi:hypothetical protein
MMMMMIPVSKPSLSQSLEQSNLLFGVWGCLAMSSLFSHCHPAMDTRKGGCSAVGVDSHKLMLLRKFYHHETHFVVVAVHTVQCSLLQNSMA